MPAERYYDPEFARLERAHLWPRVWQMACRLEEIPSPGDFVEYSVCDQSVLVVRVDESTVGAYQNACRHRATQLAMGSGTFDKGRIICPFHGWRWNLEGENTFVYGPHAFDEALLAPEELCLRRVRVDTWGGCAWINLDPAAPPLLEALDPLPSLLDPLGVADMRVNWWKSIILRANWKMAQEAFMEGYHVPQTHPQLTLGHPESYDPDSLVYSVHDHGHSSFQLRPNAQAEKGRQVGVGEIDAIIESVHLLNSGLQAMTMERDVHVIEGMRNRPIPDGLDLRRRAGEGDLPLRGGRGNQDAAAGPRRARPLGRDVLPLPQLLRPPPVRERALLPGPAARGRSRGVPVRALVDLDSRCGRRGTRPVAEGPYAPDPGPGRRQASPYSSALPALPDMGARPMVPVGKFTSVALVAFLCPMGEIRESRCGRTGSCGLCPSVRQSGTTSHHGPLVWDSNRLLKWVLVEAQWNVRRHEAKGDVYRVGHRVARRKGMGSGAVAAARKLAQIRAPQFFVGVLPTNLTLLNSRAASDHTGVVRRPPQSLSREAIWEFAAAAVQVRIGRR